MQSNRNSSAKQENKAQIKSICVSETPSITDYILLDFLKNDGNPKHQNIHKAKVVFINPKKPIPDIYQNDKTFVLNHPDSPYNRLATENNQLLEEVIAEKYGFRSPFFDCMIADSKEHRNHYDDESIRAIFSKKENEMRFFHFRKKFDELMETVNTEIAHSRDYYKEAGWVLDSAEKEEITCDKTPVKIVTLESYHRNLFLQAIAHKVLKADVFVHKFSANENSRGAERRAYASYTRREITISLKRKDIPLLNLILKKLNEAEQNIVSTTWVGYGQNGIAVKETGKSFLSLSKVLEVVKHQLLDYYKEEEKEETKKEAEVAAL